MKETFYDVLGVDSDATQAEITEAYRERVKESHPDRNDSEDAAEEFRRVARAEEVLGDPDERARYDRLGHVSYQHAVGDAGDLGRTRDGRSEDRRSGSDSGATGRNGGSRHDGNRDDDPTGGSGWSWADDARGNRNRRREYPGSDRQATAEGNRTSRSYYVGDPDRSEPSDDEGGTAGSTAGASTSATTDGGATAEGEWSPYDGGQARREARGRGEHVAADRDDEWDGFAVHDWDEEELEREPVRVSLSQQSVVLATLTFLMYPFLAFATVSPSLNPVANVLVGACTLLLLGYLLTIPRVSVAGFGALSVGVPLTLLFVGVDLLAPVSVFLVAACVVPFWYAMAFRHVVG